jgi:hypothetical protein
MQLRKEQLKGGRPVCTRCCPGRMHRHGTYERFADPPRGKEPEPREKVQRYLCYLCRLTFSVLEPHRLPYRAVRAERLQADFDQRAGIQAPSLDPPPRTGEADCLQRAWSALTSRVSLLKDTFGQLISTPVSDGISLWRNLRQSFDSVAKMLCFLSQHHRISLLGNYRCLRPPA